MRYFPFAALFVLMSAALTCGAQSRLDSILYDFQNRPDRILVAAHRAAHADYPENSLAAMREAIRLGADIIETDLRETRDGALVIMHDKSIDRTTTGKGNVSDLTWAELQRYSLLFDGKPTGEKIPSFGQVLDLVKGKIMLDIDYKADGERALRSTTAAIRAAKMEAQCLFFLYDYTDAPAAHAQDTALRFLIRAYKPADVSAILQMALPVPAVHGDDSCYSDSLMAVIRGRGKRVWLNALGKYDNLERDRPGAGFDAFRQMRYVNIIQTDLPAALLGYLRARDLHR